MYRKFKIKSFWAINMFFRSNMDFCMGEVTLDGVNEVKYTLLIWLMRHKKVSVSIYKKVQFKYSLARNMFSRSKMDFCMGEVSQ